jgi:hypothetical protein
MNEQHYKDAIQIAMNELDTLLPEYSKLQERVTNLRTFIVSGSRLSGTDARDIPDRFKLPWMLKAEGTVSFSRKVKR